MQCSLPVWDGLFDAVSAILGIRHKSSFEGEASMALEFAAEEYRETMLEKSKQQIQETETKIAAAVSDYVLLQELSDQKDDTGRTACRKNGSLGVSQRSGGTD